MSKLESRWAWCRERLARITMAFSTGTLLAFLLRFLAPSFSKARDHVAPYIALPLSTYALAEISTAIVLLALVALLTALPARIWRSFRTGLIPFEGWLWTITGLVFWTSREQNHNASGWICLLLSALLTVAGWMISRRNLVTSKSPHGWRLESDLPVPEEGEDQLDRRGLIESLLAYILGGQSAVIAVTGAYGEGKTSLLNLTIGELRKKSEDKDNVPIIVKFSPWLAGDSTALVISLLESIVAEVSTTFVVPGLGRDAARYARTLIGAIPRLDRFKSLFEEGSQEQRIVALADHIASIRKRTLVVLDDLDRMQPEELETIFKILRGSDKLSNVTFLCSFDRKELEKILRVTRPEQATATFIEKFFPVEVHIPEVETFEFRALASQRLNSMLRRYAPGSKDAADKEVEWMWEEGAGRYLKNLRRLKLFLNNIAHSLDLVAPEINFFDFVRLELIRHISPEVYECIYRDRYHFFDRDLVFETAYKAPYLDERAAKEERGRFFDELKRSIPEHQQYVFGLVASLFPHYAAYAGGRRQEVLGSKEAEKDKRIFHPRCFRQYFSLKVPSELFSQKEFSVFKSRIAGRSQNEVAATFAEVFRSLSSHEFKRFHFMHVIESRWSEFAIQEELGLCVGMAQNSFPWVFDAFELGIATDVTCELLAKITDRSQRRTLLCSVIQESTSPVYPFVLLRRLEEAFSDPSGLTSQERFRAVGFGSSQNDFGSEVLTDIQEAKAYLRDELKKRYIKADAPSIFEQFEHLGPHRIEPNIVLLGWCGLGNGAAEEERGYLVELFQRKPGQLSRFLPLMFRVDFIDDYNALKPLIDYQQLSKLIAQNETALDRNLVTKFRKRFDTDRPPQAEGEAAS